ncbi:MAG: CsbD family protein [Armatimonas sp.]
MADTLKEKIADVVDSVAGPGTSNKIEGVTNELLGGVQEHLGRVFDDEDLEEMGARKKKRGEFQQALGDDDREHSSGDSLGEVIQSKTEEVAEAARDRTKKNLDSIKNAIKETTNTIKDVM